MNTITRTTPVAVVCLFVMTALVGGLVPVTAQAFEEYFEPYSSFGGGVEYFEPYVTEYFEPYDSYDAEYFEPYTEYFEPYAYGDEYFEPYQEYFEPYDDYYEAFEDYDYYEYFEPYEESYAEHFEPYEEYFEPYEYDEYFEPYEEYFEPYDFYYEEPYYEYAEYFTPSHGVAISAPVHRSTPKVSTVRNVSNVKNVSNKTTVTRVTDKQRTVQAPFHPQPNCTITANPNHVNSGGSSTLNWSSSNATSASLSGFGSVTTGGSRTVSNITNTRIYTLTVNGPGGSNTCSTTITTQSQVPFCSISASPTSVQQGGSTTVTWNSNNATSATLTNAGTVSTSGSRTFNNLQSTQTYVLTVQGSGGSNTCSTTVGVHSGPGPSFPSCTLNINPDNVQSGNSAFMNWSSSNAISAHINNGIGSVSTSGSRTIFPNFSRTYTMTVTSSNGQTSTCSDTVTVGTGSGPFCSISVNPNFISHSGQTAVLSWNASNASNVFISGGVGSVSTSGTRTVSPNTNTTYTMTASGPNGTRTCSAHLNVGTINNPGNLFCSINASPTSIRNGESSFLRWSSNGQTAWLSDGIGTVNPNGSLSVRPSGSRNYTLTVSDGFGQTRTCSTNVNVSGGLHVSLSSVPYTGLDLGPVGNAIYWLSLLAWSVGAAYVFVRYRSQVADMALSLVGINRDPVGDAEVLHEAIVMDSNDEEVTVNEPVEAPAPAEEAPTSAPAETNQTTDHMTLEDGDEGGMPRITISRQ